MCTVVHKPLMGASVWQTTEVSMTVTVYYSDTSVRKQMTHAKLRLVFLTLRLLSALTSTQTAFIHKDSICCVQKNRAQIDRLPGAKFLLDFLALPRASSKENISGKEGTKPAKTSC